MPNFKPEIEPRSDESFNDAYSRELRDDVRLLVSKYESGELASAVFDTLVRDAYEDARERKSGDNPAYVAGFWLISGFLAGLRRKYGPQAESVLVRQVADALER